MGLRPTSPHLPTSAHSSCPMATWPTWANWRLAPTLMPPRDPRGPPWPRAAMARLPLWTSSVNRASCFAQGVPARQSARAQGHRPPPWPGARPEASASSWTVKNETQTVAGPGLFIHTFEGPKWSCVGGWGPRPLAPALAPEPHTLHLCLPLSVTSLSLGEIQPRGEGGRSGKDLKAFPVCKSMKINTTCILPDCPPAWPRGAAKPIFSAQWGH